MSHPDEPKRNWRAMFTRKNLIHLGLSVLVSMVIGLAIDLIFHSDKREELAAVRADAYVSIAQFAPWNIAYRYLDIVFTEGKPAGRAIGTAAGAEYFWVPSLRLRHAEWNVLAGWKQLGRTE